MFRKAFASTLLLGLIYSLTHASPAFAQADQILPAIGAVAIRDSLNAPAQRAFDASMQLHLARSNP